MTRFRTYKDVETGKFADYPEDVGALFYDRLVEVDPDTLQCIDCAVDQVDVTPVVDNEKSVADFKVTDDKIKDKN